MGPQSATNDFYGIQVSQVGVNVNNATPNQLTAQWDFNTGNLTFYASSGEITYGKNSNGTLGQTITDTNNNITFQQDGTTMTWYDNSGNIIMAVGYLPLVKLYGWAVATTGNTLQGVVV